jgi:iron-sulfur cluster repair protein YtfE (RIC family)
MTGQQRLAAFGIELIEIHDHLRRELADLRQALDEHRFDRDSRPRALRAHCLAFCAALGKHHTGEDIGAFPLLRKEFPELAPTIAKLADDHGLVAGILRRLNELLDGLPAELEPADTIRVLGEFDGLAAILESHFGFEERTIVAALNALNEPGLTTAALFGIAVDEAETSY